MLDAVQKAVARYRDVRQAEAFQTALFPQSGLDFETSADLALIFDENGYAYNQPYKGRTEFKKHLFRVIGDLEPTGEEHECAVYIERHPAVKAWVRNTSGQPNSFWLQTATDKFYPDFMALLTDGRVAAIEYKGGHIASAEDAEEKRLVGALWAERSGGTCLFAMIANREFNRLGALFERAI